VSFEVRMVGRDGVWRGDTGEKLRNKIDEHGVGPNLDPRPGWTSLGQRTAISNATVSDLTFVGTSVTESVTR
jgi:hypothetical protein